MHFLWPTNLNPQPGVLTRFGRVLHWIGTAMAVAVLGIMVFAAQYFLTNSYYVRDGSGPAYAFQWVTILGFSALLIYFAGRALRYILSGE